MDISNKFSDIAGDNLAYSATLDGQPLPSWISFDESIGIFSGTPANEDSSNLNIQIQANDGQEQVSIIFNLVVNGKIEGNTGNDYISGMAGNDILIGGDCNDTIEGGLGSDLLQGGARRRYFKL